MKKYKCFEETSVWRNAHQLVLNIYNISNKFPVQETYALQSQFRRAAISIEANIAEAFGRYHFLDRLKFYYNARGSAEECKSHLITGFDLKYFDQKEFSNIRIKLENIGEEINRIIVSLRSDKK